MELTNFRDLGGIVNQQGKTVKKNCLFRSGELVNLDESTKDELVHTYHLTQVIDFRRDFEIAERPDDNIAGVQMLHLDILSGVGAKNASLDDFVSLGAADKVDQHMLGVYHDLVMTPEAQTGFAQFLQAVLANNSGSTLFHCFAGKDRTGFGAALILGLLEVDDQTIMKDYLQTNQLRKKANDQIITGYQQQGASEGSLRALEIALYVKKEYLQLAQQLIKDNYGDLKTYAQQALNFGPEQIKQLQARFLD